MVLNRNYEADQVTPCTGVWIETAKSIRKACTYQSLLVQECGLKLRRKQYVKIQTKVTPCTGVWIETYNGKYVNEQTIVTPCTGVWIETRITLQTRKKKTVTPCTGVWIETYPE